LSIYEEENSLPMEDRKSQSTLREAENDSRVAESCSPRLGTAMVTVMMRGSTKHKGSVVSPSLVLVSYGPNILNEFSVSRTSDANISRIYLNDTNELSSHAVLH